MNPTAATKKTAKIISPVDIYVLQFKQPTSGASGTQKGQTGQPKLTSVSLETINGLADLAEVCRWWRANMKDTEKKQTRIG